MQVAVKDDVHNSVGIVVFGAGVYGGCEKTFQSEKVQKTLLFVGNIIGHEWGTCGNIGGLQQSRVGENLCGAREGDESDTVSRLQDKENANTGGLRLQTHLHLRELPSLLQGGHAAPNCFDRERLALFLPNQGSYLRGVFARPDSNVDTGYRAAFKASHRVGLQFLGRYPCRQKRNPHNARREPAQAAIHVPAPNERGSPSAVSVSAPIRRIRL